MENDISMDLDGGKEGDDDPVICEFDVYLNNATLGNIINDLYDLPTNVNVAKELCSKPFEGIMLLQYPLEMAMDDPMSSNDKERTVHSNASDRLKLISLKVGDVIKKDTNNKRAHDTTALNKYNRRDKCPLLRLDYDLGEAYSVNYKNINTKKQSKSIKQQHLASKSSSLLSALIDSDEPETNRTLTLESSIATNEYIMDCLGILKVENTGNGLERSLHILPVRGIVQLRPKFNLPAEELSDDNLMNLFYNENVRWRPIDRIYHEGSEESNELIEQFLLHGKVAGDTFEDVKFMGDTNMYVNSICLSVGHGMPCTSQLFSGCMSSASIDTVQMLENVIDTPKYTKPHHLTPDLRFMSKLDVEMQLMLLLSQRYIDTFYSLKEDIFINDTIDDFKLIEILKKIAKNIDGNWVISSEYAIANYTEDDDCNKDERNYLISCRNLMLSLLNRQTCQPSMLKANTSVGYLASEPFKNATGLPLNMVNDLLATIAKPQGKFWSLKLKRDEKFYLKYPKIVQSYQKYWSNTLIESANTIQSYKNNTNFTVNQMVNNVFTKYAIVNFLKNRIHTTNDIIEHLASLGYSQTSSFNDILNQIAIPVHKPYGNYWILKQNNIALELFKHAILSNIHMPNFVTRRIYKFTNYSS